MQVEKAYLENNYHKLKTFNLMDFLSLPHWHLGNSLYFPACPHCTLPLPSHVSQDLGSIHTFYDHIPMPFLNAFLNVWLEPRGPSHTSWPLPCGSH